MNRKDGSRGPSHLRPEWVQLRHDGRFSSHLTLRVLDHKSERAVPRVEGGGAGEGQDKLTCKSSIHFWISHVQVCEDASGILMVPAQGNKDSD